VRVKKRAKMTHLIEMNAIVKLVDWMTKSEAEMEKDGGWRRSRS